MPARSPKLPPDAKVVQVGKGEAAKWRVEWTLPDRRRRQRTLGTTAEGWSRSRATQALLDLIEEANRAATDEVARRREARVSEMRQLQPSEFNAHLSDVVEEAAARVTSRDTSEALQAVELAETYRSIFGLGMRRMTEAKRPYADRAAWQRRLLRGQPESLTEQERPEVSSVSEDELLRELREMDRG